MSVRGSSQRFGFLRPLRYLFGKRAVGKSGDLYRSCDAPRIGGGAFFEIRNIDAVFPQPLPKLQSCSLQFFTEGFYTLLGYDGK